MSSIKIELKYPIVGIDVEQCENDKEAPSEPEVPRHEGQQDEVEAKCHQVDQSLLTPVFSCQVCHVAVQSLMLSHSSLGGAPCNSHQAPTNPSKAENREDQRPRQKPGQELDEHHQVIGDVCKHPPSLAVMVEACAHQGSEKDPTNHPGPVLEDPGEGGGEGRRSCVADSDALEHCGCGETAGHGGGECLESVPHLIVLPVEATLVTIAVHHLVFQIVLAHRVWIAVRQKHLLSRHKDTML